MSRYIDADAIITFVSAGHLRNPMEKTWSDNDVVDMIESRPTVDAVPVVRCKDCIYAERARVNDKGFTICGASYMDITDNDFCSYGERKGGERKDDDKDD